MKPITDIHLQFEWTAVGESVRAPELRATWARLELWVGNDCVTLAEDAATGSTRRSIHVPLYPLAEWVAYNWWQLRFDGRIDGPPHRIRRRNLRSAGDGFLWPDVEFLPGGRVSRISWKGRETPPDAVLRYLTSGRRWVDSSLLEAALAGLVEAVITRLDESGLEDTALQKEWARLTSMDADEAEFCEFAARLGLDPLSEGVDLAVSIDDAFQTFAPGLSVEFFDAVDPEGIDQAVRWVNESLEDARHQTRVRDAVFRPEQLIGSHLTAGEQGSGVPPWVLGYEAARQLRRTLGLDAADVMVDLPVALLLHEDGVREVAAAGATPRDDGVINLVLPRRMRSDAERFAMSRALWHAVQGDGRDGFLLTSAGTTSQRVGRAFAAELLAPAAGIQDLLTVEPRAATPEELVAVADHYRTSDLVIEHQVRNQLLAT